MRPVWKLCAGLVPGLDRSHCVCGAAASGQTERVRFAELPGLSVGLFRPSSGRVSAVHLLPVILPAVPAVSSREIRRVRRLSGQPERPDEYHEPCCRGSSPAGVRIVPMRVDHRV